MTIVNEKAESDKENLLHKHIEDVKEITSLVDKVKQEN